MHGHCSSCIYYFNNFFSPLRLTLISTLSFSFHHNSLFLSSQLCKAISFSFFFKISGFKDEDDDSSVEISCATDWVRSASLGGEWVGNADVGDEDGDRKLIGREQSAAGCGWFCSASIRVKIHGWLGVGIQGLDLHQESAIELRVPCQEDSGWLGDFVLFDCWWWLVAGYGWF